MHFTQMFGYSSDDEPDSPAEPRRPVWLGPAEHELGRAVPLGLVLAQSETGVVALSHAVAYSTGLAFDFVAQAQGLSRSRANSLFHEQHAFEDDGLPDGLLRLGIELADGSRASNLGGRRAYRLTTDTPPDGPLLLPYAGGGGQAGNGRVSLRPGYWLWPLPPAGPLRIACEWPIVGIPLTTTEVDGEPLVEAARRTISLWPPG